MFNNFRIELEVLQAFTSCYDLWKAPLLLAPLKYAQQLSKLQLNAVNAITRYT